MGGVGEHQRSKTESTPFFSADSKCVSLEQRILSDKGTGSIVMPTQHNRKPRCLPAATTQPRAFHSM